MKLTELQKRQVRSAMAMKGINFTTIAKKLKVTRQHVSNVFNGKRPTHKVRKAIARAAGMRVGDLWPRPPKLGLDI